jgi:orotate phosphoribosyltransferase
MDPAPALRAMLLDKSVRTGRFTLASGQESDLYIDCRLTTLDCHGANLVGALGWHTLRDYLAGHHLSATAIGGMTLGADPIALAIGMTSARLDPDCALQVFTVRKEPKEHGRGRQIEGNFTAGDAVVVVDDVITTGGSTLKAIDVIERAGGTVVLALVLVDREEGGREALEARGIPVLPLFTRTTLLEGL